MTTSPSPYTLEHVQQILESYQRLLGTPLVTEAHGADFAARARWLYEDAPFCLLAHSAEADPRFTYANLTTLRCFEYSHSEFIGLPSRLSAEADQRQERDTFVHTVQRQGYAQGYRGLRISKSGRRFWIEDVTMWNVFDASSGVMIGQAAQYSRTSS